MNRPDQMYGNFILALPNGRMCVQVIYLLLNRCENKQKKPLMNDKENETTDYQYQFAKEKKCVETSGQILRRMKNKTCSLIER